MDKKMNIPFSPPDITEEEITEIANVLRSGWITTGPQTKIFEKELASYSNTNRMICLNSATAAMEMTLYLLGVGPGDEVILPAYTYSATASVVCHVGATPVIVDIQKNHPEMEYDKLDTYINEKTKVIVPVDIGGIICDYDAIYKVIERNKNKFKANNKLQEKFNRIIVMSDCAHGFGATKNGIKAGNQADFTCYSFHAVKNLTTAEGGAITWKPIPGVNDEDIYNKLVRLSLHGQTKDALSKMKLGSWEYDIEYPAYKCNMTDILASVGRTQLKRYDEMLRIRHKVIERYDRVFNQELGLYVLNHKDENHRSSGHLYFIRPNITLEQRNEIIEKIAEKGVATNVHYKPLPLLTAYKNLGFKIEDVPNAYDYYCNEITLPLYSKLTEEEVTYIIDVVSSVLKEYI